jgi:hypothetical protein
LKGVLDNHPRAFGSVRIYEHQDMRFRLHWRRRHIFQPLDTSKNGCAHYLSPDFRSSAASSSALTRTSTSSISIECRASAAPVDRPPEEQEPAQPEEPRAKGEQPNGVITGVQVKRLESIAGECGWRPDDLLGWLRSKYNVRSAAEILQGDYEHIVDLVRNGGEGTPAK